MKRNGIGLVIFSFIIFLFAAPALAVDFLVPPGFDYENFAEGGLLTGAGAMALSQDGGMYIINKRPDAYGGQVLKVDMVTREMTVFLDGAPFYAPNDILLGDGRAVTGTDLIVSDHNSEETHYCCDGRVFRVDRLTGDYTVLSEGNPYNPPEDTHDDPAMLALGPGNAFGDGLYVVDFNGASPYPPVLFRILGDGTREVFAVDPVLWHTERSPAHLDFDTSGAFGGDLFVSDNPGGSALPTIWRVSPEGELSIFYQGAAGDTFSNLVFGPGGAFGTDLYMLGVINGAAGLLRMAPDGSYSVFASLAANPPSNVIATPGLEFSPDGQSLFFSLGDAIYRIFPAAACEDSDGDGVIDDWDACPDTPAGTCVNSNGCPGSVLPNATLELNSLGLTVVKKHGKASLELSGAVDVPELSVPGDSTGSRVTVEFFGVMPDGSDLVISNEGEVSIQETAGTIKFKD